MTPVTLTGTAGLSTPYTNTVTANPTPSWPPSGNGLYTARCPYAQMVGNLRTGTWMVSVNATGVGGSWQAQCQAIVPTGMKAITFTWGKMNWPLNEASFFAAVLS